MTENLNLGFQLLVVGMVSVFMILGIVVLIGKLLITAVNKWSAEEHFTSKVDKIDKKKIAVISAVVQTITKGTGIVGSINKI